MKAELDKKLCEKYPKIFANRHGDMRSTAMCWGFECRDGWYDLIDKLCSNLQWNTDRNNKEYVIKNPKLRKLIPVLFNVVKLIPIKSFRRLLNTEINNWRMSLDFIYVESNRYPQITAVQVKEKFGGLRFYVNGASDRQYAVINFAESLSYHICERCGSNQNIGSTKGWITTLCEKCAIETKSSSWIKHNEDVEADELENIEANNLNDE